LEALPLKVIFLQCILFDGKADVFENKGKNGKQMAGTT
jgi:hypothetical protein